MKTDIEIAQSSTMQHIRDIAKVANVEEKYLEQYGNYKAKVDYNLLKEHTGPDGKLILVTAITPTPAGEGKTTTTVGLADGLRKIGKRSVVALREPRISTSTSPATSTPSARPTTCWLRCWTTTFSRATPWGST